MVMSGIDRKKWAEEEFEKISSELKRQDHLTYEDFLRIRNFKLRVHTVETRRNIKSKTEKAFVDAKNDETKKAVEALTLLHGVQIPIASAILAVKYPEKYCIIDKKVIKGLLTEKLISKKTAKKWVVLKGGSSQYTKNVNIYEEYLKIMKKGSRRRRMKLRDYERTLFENGVISSEKNTATGVRRKRKTKV
jgi:hypothetical protein